MAAPESTKGAWVRPEVRSLTTADARADVPDVAIANGVSNPAN